MKRKLDDSKPLFLQIKDRIEDQIVNRQLKEHEQIPSTTQLVNFYKVNHLTVAKESISSSKKASFTRRGEWGCSWPKDGTGKIAQTKAGTVCR